ncbi:helix-turn-helix domain-containing protein [Spirillospora sp. NPDC047279]|uniref:PucR family transcriptional regulator n=1 Tax=Spirillospora sp. NPDC047279 TaxID=3155478 RepID=UPI0033E4AFBA
MIGDDPRGGLLALARTVSALTGGTAVIEDASGRVVAAFPGDVPRDADGAGGAEGADEAGGWRARGVRRRLRAGEDVLPVGPGGESGLPRGLAIGVGPAGRPLGAIWVAEDGAPLAAGCEEALRGAARLAVPRFIDHYHGDDPAVRAASREDLAHGLLTGRFNAMAVAAHLDVDPDSAVAVVAVDLRERPGEPGGEVRRAEAAEIVSLHAAAYRRNALVTQACGQIYAMLPDTAGRFADPAAEPALVRWAGDLAGALRRHTGTAVQAALGGVAPHLDEIPAAKMRAHRTLKIIEVEPDRPVATHSGVRSALVLRDLLDLLAARPEIRHPALEELVAHDAEQGTELARSLLLYLDTFGDVGRAAQRLHVHPNTLRYRVRRAAELAGIDLDDADERLVTMLQLRLLLAADASGPAFPLSPA